LLKGLKCFEGALARDPNYALAHTGVADVYSLLSYYGYARPHDVMPKARAAAERALALDPKLAEAHCARGVILLFYGWDLPGAKRAFERSIALRPTHVPARYHLAGCLMAMRRYPESVIADEEAVRIEPLSLFANGHLGWMLACAGRTEEAALRLEHTIDLDSRFFLAHWLLGYTYVIQGRVEEGLAELRLGVTMSANLPWMVATLGCALAWLGRKDEAREILAELKRRSGTEYVRAYLFAQIHGYLGDEEESFHWLNLAIDERDGVIPMMDMLPETAFSGAVPNLNPARRAAFATKLAITRE
jgi:tetratricopeptide (TPR) repeat protein